MTIMPMKPKPTTRRTPHNKSPRARAAEKRGERPWTGWRLGDLVQQVLLVNTRGLVEKDLREVKDLELLKVKFLAPTEQHHTKLRMPDPLTLNQDQYFGLKKKLATNLDPREVAKWRDHPLTDEELDEAVENLTGRIYSRKRKR